MLPQGVHPFWDFLNSRLHLSEADRCRIESTRQAELVRETHCQEVKSLKERIKELEELLEDIGRSIEGSEKWGADLDTKSIVADIHNAGVVFNSRHPIQYYKLD